MITHPIITPNFVIGKFMYTKADNDEGEGVTILTAATAYSTAVWLDGIS